MKKHVSGMYLFLIIICVACQGPASKQTTTPGSAQDGEIVAHVGDTTITAGQLKEKQKQFRFGERRQEKILDDLINSRLLYLGAKNKGLDQDPEVQMRIQDQIERILGQIYINQEISSLGKTDKELQEYYDAHQDEFKTPQKATISHIVCSDDEVVNSVKSDISSGKISFEDAARKYSEDKNTARNGGALGQATQGKFIPLIGVYPEINQAIFSAQVGNVIGPFKTSKGFHLLKIASIDKEKFEPFENVKRKIIDRLEVSDDEVAQSYEKVKDKRFKKKASVKVRHIQLKTEKDAQTTLARLNKGEKFEVLVRDLSQDKQSVQSKGDLGTIYPDGYIPRIGMDKDLNKSIFEQEIGQLSAVLKSAKGYHVFEVYEKTPEAYHDLDQVRSSIINILAGQKRVDLRQNLMKKLEKDFGVEKHLKSDTNEPAQKEKSKKGGSPKPKSE